MTDTQALFEQGRLLMAQHHVPGVAIGLLKDGSHVKGLGITSVDQPSSVDQHTLFQLASITKLFTATAAMRLAELGRVKLDVPVRKYLPELSLADEAVAANVTLRHLLTHTGGWSSEPSFPDIGDDDLALQRSVQELTGKPQVEPLEAAKNPTQKAA